MNVYWCYCFMHYTCISSLWKNHHVSAYKHLKNIKQYTETENNCALMDCVGKGLRYLTLEARQLHHFVVRITHDDIIKWKHFLRYWPFWGESIGHPVDSPHKDQWRGDLMFSLICAWTNGWANNRDAGDLRRHRAHCEVSINKFQKVRIILWT